MASKLVANVLPGTDVTFVVEKVLIKGMKDNFRRFDAPESVPTVRLGQGLIQGGDGIRAVIAGSLVFAKPCRFWVEAHIKRVSIFILSFILIQLRHPEF